MKFESNLTATNKKAYPKSKKQYKLAKSKLAENVRIQANNRKELEKDQSNCFEAQIADITLSMMQFIMLSYFKRVNYQQSIGGLFKEISHELVMDNLVKRLMEIFWELIEILCDMVGIEFMELQKDAINNDAFTKEFISFQTPRTLNKAA